MAVSFKSPDLEWGQIWYVSTDADQFPHALVGVIILPGKQTKFVLSFMGDEIVVYDFECSLDRAPVPGETDEED